MNLGLNKTDFKGSRKNQFIFCSSSSQNIQIFAITLRLWFNSNVELNIKQGTFTLTQGF